MKRFARLMLVAGLMAAPVPVLAAKAPADPLKVSKVESFKGLQTVAIGGFTIGFLIERKDTAKAGGGLMGNGMGGRSTVRSYLSGVSPADLQAITDAAYADFKAQLTAAGYSIVPAADLLAHPDFAKAKRQPSPYAAKTMFQEDADAKALYVGPSEMGGVHLYPMDVWANGLGALATMSATTGNQMAAGGYVAKTKTPILNVIYMVDFADSDKYGGWFRSSSAVRVKASLAIVPEMSKLTLWLPGYKSATITMKQPVAVGGDFGQFEDATRTASRIDQGIANAIGILGGIGTNSSKKYTLSVKSDQYRGAVTDAAVQANGALVQRLSAMR